MLRRLAFPICAAAVAASAVTGTRAQGPDPKTAFTEALARFSLALHGAYGDEGPVASASLAALDRIRQQWDGLLRTYEAGMARELLGAPPDLAVRMHLALGGEYLDRRRLPDAMREFGEAIRLDPKRPDALTARGLIQAHLTPQSREALDDFGRAASLTPSDPVRGYLLARQALAAGSAADAPSALRQFVSAAATAGPSRDAAPFVRLGLVQEVAGIEPFFPPAPYRDGFHLLDDGRYEDAISRLKTATILDPLITPRAEVADALRVAGAALRDGAPDVALARLEPAAALVPDTAEVHRLLGLAHLANDETETGLNALRRAVRLDPSYERPRIDLARALFDRGQFADAATILTETLAAIPDSGRARYLLGLVHQRQGNYTAAMEDFADAARQRPLLGLNSVLQTMGALRRSQQDYDGAVEAFSRRIELVPNDAAAHHELGEMYFRKGLLPQALAEYTVELFIDPTRPDAHIGVAQVRLRDEHFEEAAAAARRAVALDTTHKQARYVLGTALRRLGRQDDGNRQLPEYQRLQAEATARESRRLELAALRRDASVNMANGNYDRAVELLAKALAAGPGDPASELDLGQALFKAGKAADAVPHLRAALAPGATPDVHRLLAEAYAATGQANESRHERTLYMQARQEALRRAGGAR
jgi:tetratricopeptide (TPR) repeat protein